MIELIEMLKEMSAMEFLGVCIATLGLLSALFK